MNHGSKLFSFLSLQTSSVNMFQTKNTLKFYPSKIIWIEVRFRIKFDRNRLTLNFVKACSHRQKDQSAAHQHYVVTVGVNRS